MIEVFTDKIQTLPNKITKFSTYFKQFSEEFDEPIPILGCSDNGNFDFEVFNIFTEWFDLLVKFDVCNVCDCCDCFNDFGNYCYLNYQTNNQNQIIKPKTSNNEVYNIIYNPIFFKDFDDSLLLRILNFGTANQIEILVKTIAYLLKNNDWWFIKEIQKKEYIEYTPGILNYIVYESYDRFNFIDNELNKNQNQYIQTNKLINLTFTKSVKEIGKQFAKMQNLNAIYIPDNIIYIEEGAFDRCENLIHINSTNGFDTLPNLENPKNIFTYCNKIKKNYCSEKLYKV